MIIPLNNAKYMYKVPISLAFVLYNHLRHQSKSNPDLVLRYDLVSKMKTKPYL